mgnify:CR=1 FL=1
MIEGSEREKKDRNNKRGRERMIKRKKNNEKERENS